MLGEEACRDHPHMVGAMIFVLESSQLSFADVTAAGAAMADID